ncbi:hypothetical protein [Microbacterium profundi]
MDDLASGTWHIVELPDGSLIDVVAFRSRRGASRRIIGIDRPVAPDKQKSLRLWRESLRLIRAPPGT